MKTGPIRPAARIQMDGPVAVIDAREVRDATIRNLTQAVERLQREAQALR